MKVNEIRIKFLMILVLGMIVVSACSTFQRQNEQESADASSIIDVVTNDTVIAEGNLVPKDYDYVSFAKGGTVTEILVSKGDLVQKDQVLARLGDKEQNEAEIAGAELEVTRAQQNYDDLMRNADLNKAIAWQDRITKSNALIAASRNWEEYDTETYDQQIEDAKIEVKNSRDDLDNAKEELDKYKDLAEDNRERTNAQDNYDEALREYDESVRIRDELENQRDLAKASLDLAEANLEEAQRKFDLAQNGPDEEQLSIAEARLKFAKSQLLAAESSLDYLEIKAPYEGTIVDINISANQLVGPDNWAFLIADFRDWFIETTDLSELEVINITEGQAAVLVPDSLPDIKLTGIVDEIDKKSYTFAGDVLYKVRILVTETDPRLRWGMTIEVSFQP